MSDPDPMTTPPPPDSAASDKGEGANPFGLEAQLAEARADPAWRAKWSAQQDDERPFLVMVQALRADEGDSITLLCDNPDFNGQPNNAVECCGAWTGWTDRRFTGDTLRGAVQAAYLAKQEAEAPPLSAQNTAEQSGKPRGADRLIARLNQAVNTMPFDAWTLRELAREAAEVLSNLSPTVLGEGGSSVARAEVAASTGVKSDSAEGH